MKKYSVTFVDHISKQVLTKGVIASNKKDARAKYNGYRILSVDAVK